MVIKILGYIILAIVLIFLVVLWYGNYRYEKARKQKDPDNILPNWFDGKIYDEGKEVVSRNSGKSILLDKYELTMYDLIMGINYMGDHRGWKNEMIELVEKGQNWFKEKNPEAHKILFQSDISTLKEAPDEPNEIPLENQLKKNEKRLFDFSNVEEALKFLKTHDDIKIKVSRSVQFDGFYQLIDDKEEKAERTMKELENMAGGELWSDMPEEDYDLNKPVYQSRGIEKWANGYTSKANLIKVLNELINCEQRYWTSELEEEINGHSGSYPEDWMKYFDAFDVKSGVRNRKGKEISWWGHYYTQSEESDIILIT